MNTKKNIWLELCKVERPTITEDAAAALSMKAASEWYLGSDTKLAEMFDKYVMLKTLKGFENGEETSSK